MSLGSSATSIELPTRCGPSGSMRETEAARMLVTQTASSPVASERGSVPRGTVPAGRVGLRVDPRDLLGPGLRDPDPAAAGRDVARVGALAERDHHRLGALERVEPVERVRSLAHRPDRVEADATATGLGTSTRKSRSPLPWAMPSTSSPLARGDPDALGPDGDAGGPAPDRDRCSGARPVVRSAGAAVLAATGEQGHGHTSGRDERRGTDQQRPPAPAAGTRDRLAVGGGRGRRGSPGRLERVRLEALDHGVERAAEGARRLEALVGVDRHRLRDHRVEPGRDLGAHRSKVAAGARSRARTGSRARSRAGTAACPVSA